MSSGFLSDFRTSKSNVHGKGQESLYSSRIMDFDGCFLFSRVRKAQNGNICRNDGCSRHFSCSNRLVQLYRERSVKRLEDRLYLIRNSNLIYFKV